MMLDNVLDDVGGFWMEIQSLLPGNETNMAISHDQDGQTDFFTWMTGPRDDWGYNEER